MGVLELVIERQRSADGIQYVNGWESIPGRNTSINLDKQNHRTMTTEKIADRQIEFDEDGFLANREDWTEELAQELAYMEDVGQLTDKHWKVIRFMQAEYDEKGDAPSIRKLNKESGVSTKELYQLFPKGPAKKAAKIAGLPKPKGCI